MHMPCLLKSVPFTVDHLDEYQMPLIVVDAVNLDHVVMLMHSCPSWDDADHDDEHIRHHPGP